MKTESQTSHWRGGTMDKQSGIQPRIDTHQDTDLDETLDEAAQGASLETSEAEDETSATDAIGRAAGLEVRDDKPFRGIEEVERRDQHRWELDPASRLEDEPEDEPEDDELAAK